LLLAFSAAMQAVKAAPLVAPIDAAHLSRTPASAVEVSAASTAAQKANILMVCPPSAPHALDRNETTRRRKPRPAFDLPFGERWRVISDSVEALHNRNNLRGWRHARSNAIIHSMDGKADRSIRARYEGIPTTASCGR
jgi:hypothetical protein